MAGKVDDELVEPWGIDQGLDSGFEIAREDRLLIVDDERDVEPFGLEPFRDGNGA